MPAPVFGRPMSLAEPGGEAEQALHIERVGNPVQMVHQLGLGGITLRPLPAVVDLLGEKVAVEIDAIGIDARAGIAIVIPGAAHARCAFDADDGEAFAGEAPGGVDAAEAGADDGHVELFFVHRSVASSTLVTQALAGVQLSSVSSST